MIGRRSLCILATMVAFADISPVVAQAPSTTCAAVATMSPNTGLYMADMNKAAPMPGQMMRENMTMGQVAQSAAQKEKCMSEELRQEERAMDGRKR